MTSFDVQVSRRPFHMIYRDANWQRWKIYFHRPSSVLVHSEKKTNFFFLLREGKTKIRERLDWQCFFFWVGNERRKYIVDGVFPSFSLLQQYAHAFTSFFLPLVSTSHAPENLSSESKREKKSIKSHLDCASVLSNVIFFGSGTHCCSLSTCLHTIIMC